MSERGDIRPHCAEAPLYGRFVLVTRARHQAQALAGPLEAQGATIVAMPVIDIVDPPDPEALRQAARDIAGYDWLVLSSTNAVDRLWAEIEAAGTSGGLAGVRIAVVGTATARALSRRGLQPDFVPDKFRAEGVLDAMRTRVSSESGHPCRVLYVRALDGRDVLVEGLRSLGCVVDLVAAYATVPATPEPEVLALLRSGRIDVATFLSPSAVRNFVALVVSAGLDTQSVLSGLAVASIGPVTSEAVRAVGAVVSIEPATSTVPALVEAIVGKLSA